MSIVNGQDIVHDATKLYVALDACEKCELWCFFTVWIRPSVITLSKCSFHDHPFELITVLTPLAPFPEPHGSAFLLF